MDAFRICTKCNKEVPVILFPIQRNGKKYESMANYCRECRGKQQRENLNKNPESYLKDRHRRLKISAKEKQISFNLDLEYIINLYNKQNGKCFYTDEEMLVKYGYGLNPMCLSFDRIIPELGYTKNNIVLCCNRINSVKNNLTMNELKEWIPKWYNKIKNKDAD